MLMELDIRLVRPTDIVALAAFRGRACRNEARARNRIHQEFSGVSPFSSLHRLSPWEAPKTWACFSGQNIQGIVAARSRCGPCVWEVDSLLLDRDLPDEEVALALLGKLSDDGSKTGVQKVFLRLDKDSPLVPVARKAGFINYLTEIIYCRRQATTSMFAAPRAIREKSRGDHRLLFQLYNATVPETVRQAEATTFQEWQDTRERNSVLSRRKEYVYERDGKALGWLAVAIAGGSAEFQLMTVPGEPELADALIGHALTLLNGRSPVYALVPEYQPGVARSLDVLGFEEVGAYSTQVKQLAVRLRQPRLAPFQI